MAWNSHGRQIKSIESVVKFRKELEQATAEHVLVETELRFERKSFYSGLWKFLKLWALELAEKCL